jgi:hypothetical protein
VKTIKAKKDKKSQREQILLSMLASFKMEGINIPMKSALEVLKKIELNKDDKRLL